MIRLVLALTVCSLVSVSSSVAAPPANLVGALSSRHLDYSVEELEAMVGGADNLVTHLIELRHNESRPFVGVRAEKLLLGYADREEVQMALGDDLRSSKMAGLARIITVHIDRAPTAEARQLFATLALERAERDIRFRGYAQALVDSKDEVVSNLARKALR